MKSKIKVKTEKKSQWKSQIKEKSAYSLYTIIPAEVVHTLQLQAGNEIIYNIKETSLNEFECEISFKADHLEQVESPRETEPILDANPSPSDIDKVMIETEKPKAAANNMKSPAGNTLDVKKFEDVQLKDGEYTIKVTSPARPKLRIVGSTIQDELNKKEIALTVTNKTEDEVQAIIDNLVSCENPSAKALNEIVNSYRSEQYRS